jgi:leucine-rich repeat protein SHOC2
VNSIDKLEEKMDNFKAVDITMMRKTSIENAITMAKQNKLANLNLHYYNFDLIPANIGDLIDLREFKIGTHGLTTLPESIGSLVNLRILKISGNNIDKLPRSIGNLVKLTELDLSDNKLISLPENIGSLSRVKILKINGNNIKKLPKSTENFAKLTELNLSGNRLTSLPKNIGNFTKLRWLSISTMSLKKLPSSIGNLINLTYLDVSANSLSILPRTFKNLVELNALDISNNQLENLPTSFSKLTNLIQVNLNGNPLDDLSILQSLTNLKTVYFLGVVLPRQYWTKFSEWKAEIRRTLIEHVGYKKICDELQASAISSWKEYTLLKIDDLERAFRPIIHPYWGTEFEEELYIEPMVLLKMTCPSTQHIHVLRVPPEMISAEEAITWVNHGIHPDEITLAT